MELGDSGVACGSNLLILKDAVLVWRADLGREPRIPQKLSKSQEILICKTCYWAYPESYRHIAMRDIRRLDLFWSGEEVADYEILLEEAAKLQEEAHEYVKNVLHSHFKKKSS